MYRTLGSVPQKRHIIFCDAKGALLHEQLFGTEGFHGKSSLMYHLRPPTQISALGDKKKITPLSDKDQFPKPRKFKGQDFKKSSSYESGKQPLLFNDHVLIGISNSEGATDASFYKSADCDILLFIHKGQGLMKSVFGDLGFYEGDYVVIPRGTIYQLEFTTKEVRVLYVESRDEIWFPARYMNKFGQLLEHAPFCERDIRTPEYAEPIDESGDFAIKLSKGEYEYELHYNCHPFDVVGWDGYHYPFALSIHDFEPITGRVHQPPPVHQTFSTSSFVVCSFVPRLYDYHPQAIPAPYNHSNIDSDEVLYYVDGDFMSRVGVEPGQFTLHPSGIPHGPHPGTVEKSIGEKETRELAVMIDTFTSLKPTVQASSVEDKSYHLSWTK